jgi:purine-nucleoside phosphorylase
MPTVALPVRVFAALGARVMVATNAAGGVNAQFNVGDVMVIRDHISFPGLAGVNPFVGANPPAAGGGDALGPRFFPLTAAYTPLLRDLAERVAAARGLGDCLRSGVYFHDSGPAYETPAEIALMRALGGDAVGMSTAPEVAAAAHAGMAVLGLSLITNKCRCVRGRGNAQKRRRGGGAWVRAASFSFLLPHYCRY